MIDMLPASFNQQSSYENTLEHPVQLSSMQPNHETTDYISVMPPIVKQEGQVPGQMPQSQPNNALPYTFRPANMSSSNLADLFDLDDIFRGHLLVSHAFVILSYLLSFHFR